MLLAILFAGGAPLLARTSLRVHAAASLTDVFHVLEAEFERRHPHIDVLLNLAASSTLANQLLLGAPADVFASADEAQMRRVQDADLAHAATIFAGNSLSLAVPADNPADLTEVGDLARPGVRLVLAAPGVPVRSYSEELLERLAQLQGFDVADVLENVVSEESNVRLVLFKIAHGDADAGFIYRSDITPELAGHVRTLPIDRSANARVRYPAAVLAASDHAREAQLFIDFLLSPAGQQQLRLHGFEPATRTNTPVFWPFCGMTHPA